VITFGLDLINPISILIERTLSKLKEKGKFTIQDIISNLEHDHKTSTETKMLQ